MADVEKHAEQKRSGAFAAEESPQQQADGGAPPGVTWRPDCRHFDALAWDALNARVRPFTAKWHRASEQGALEPRRA